MLPEKSYSPLSRQLLYLLTLAACHRDLVINFCIFQVALPSCLLFPKIVEIFAWGQSKHFDLSSVE